MKRLLVVLASLIAGLIGVVGALTVLEPARAEPTYPPVTPDAEVNRGTVTEGGTVVFSGKAQPNETLTISVNYSSSGGGNFFAPRRAPRAVIGTVVADALGDWSIAVRLTRPGIAVLTATGNLGTVLTEQVRVVLDQEAGLAATGVAAGRLPAIALTGLGAVLLGGLLVFGAVRWRRRTAVPQA